MTSKKTPFGERRIIINENCYSAYQCEVQCVVVFFVQGGVESRDL